jgi:capsular exopolysaccharide synthesis family protein
VEGALHAVREHLQLVLGFAAAVLVAALAATLLTTRQYRAVAVLQLLPRAGQEVAVDAVVKHDEVGYQETRDRMRTQMQIIQSRSVREEAIRRYGELGYNDLSLSPADLERFGRALSCTPQEDTELVEVAVLWPDAERAAALANVVTQAYADGSLRARTDAAQQTQVWLGGQTETQKRALEAASAAVLAFKAANGLADIDEKTDGVSARLASLQAAAGQATTQRVLLESKIKEHRQLLDRGQYDVLAGMFQDPALETMARERASIVTESAEVVARYGNQHPDHIRAQERIKRVDGLVAVEVRRLVEAEASLIETLSRQEAEIGAELAVVNQDLLEKQKLEAQYDELREAEERARSLYSALGSRGAEVDLQARTRLNDVRIVDPAVPPSGAARPNVPLNLAMGLFVGFAGGIGLALGRQRMRDTFLSPADVARSLQAALLGVIPRLPAGLDGARRDLYAHEHPRSRAAESFRGIRAIVQALPARQGALSLVVTSSVAGEGKSLGAVGLAASFGQLGKRVLLIDADLRLPRLHVLFGLEPGPGLADVPGAVVRELVAPTPLPGVSLLRSGGPAEYPNEFLASAAVVAALGELGGLYDVIVMDTPPAGLVSDTLALARAADGVVMIVRRGVVPRPMVSRTLAELGRAGVPVLGVVLNDMPLGRENAGYAAGYYDDRARRAQSASS